MKKCKLCNGSGFVSEPQKKLANPSAIYQELSHYAKKEQEHFLVISLNGNNEIIKKHVVSIGLVNQTQVHPREVFKHAIRDNATAIVIAHNHPSGQLEPSQDDRKVTRALTDASIVIGIDILDHLIITANGCYSFLEHGVL